MSQSINQKNIYPDGYLFATLNEQTDHIALFCYFTKNEQNHKILKLEVQKILHQLVLQHKIAQFQRIKQVIHTKPIHCEKVVKLSKKFDKSFRIEMHFVKRQNVQQKTIRCTKDKIYRGRFTKFIFCYIYETNFKAKYLDAKNTCSNDVHKFSTQFETEQANLSNLVDGHKRLNKGTTADKNNARARVHKAKTDLDSARSRFSSTAHNYDIANTKISHGDTFFKIADTQQRSKAIKSKLDEIQKGLNYCNSRLSAQKPSYDDFVSNYDDLSKVRESSYNNAYKTIYKDDKVEFTDDNNGGAHFAGKNQLGRYTQKVFGFGPAQGNIKTNNYDPFSRYGANQHVQVSRCNVLSPAWGSAHGNPLDDDNGGKGKGGQKFEQNNFTCDVNNKNNLPSFRGRVVSFSKNVTKVVNDQNETCQLNFAGSSRIEVANKQLPEAGDDIYWKGTQQGTGQNGKQYNPHHVFCF